MKPSSAVVTRCFRETSAVVSLPLSTKGRSPAKAPRTWSRRIDVATTRLRLDSRNSISRSVGSAT